MSQKPSLPRGTRDFGPAQMVRRNFIFDAIKTTYRTFGFMPLETPAMENLSVLTGKYGEEGDQLLYKILNSRPHEAKDAVKEQMREEFGRMLTRNVNSPVLTEKGLRYDLTVPFARYVVMNRNDIKFPFKRYQIQPVWRADSPQKGRYREFYQCDADVVGTDSLLCEAEIVLMITEVLARLNITEYVIKLNNRKVLTGLAEVAGAAGKEAELCVAIDKLDKIGKERVILELQERGFSPESIHRLDPVFTIAGDFAQKIAQLEALFADSPAGQQGVRELTGVMNYLQGFGAGNIRLELDTTLARGLSYYTGAIFEVKATNVQIGSIGGGGRYDNLTGAFGLAGISGVGFSFGVDRIYDVMEELGLFPQNNAGTTRVLFCTFDAEAHAYALPRLQQLRQAGISSELYPEATKLKKQLDYANAKNIPFVILIGSDEMASGELTLKNMHTGEQQRLPMEAVVEAVK